MIKLRSRRVWFLTVILILRPHFGAEMKPDSPPA